MYPTPKQSQRLYNNLELRRTTYNRILSIISGEKGKGNKVTKKYTQNLLPEWKKNNPALKSVYSKTLQMVNHQVWSNILGLSKLKKTGRKIGRLRYKGKNWYKTLNYNQSGFKVNEDANRIHFSKIGSIKTIIHRPIDGIVKGIIIKKTNTNKMFAYVQIEKDEPPLNPIDKEVGFDLGISYFITDTDKHQFEYPNNIDKSLLKIKKYQKNLSRKKKGSNNRRKAKLQLNRVYEKLDNQRNDYLHGVSHYYIKNYDFIAYEDLNIQGMLKNNGSKRSTLNRHILDASWGKFIAMLESKAERAGRKTVTVNPKNTTQKCSQCKKIIPKTLKVRVHSCWNCGFEADRDYNAALNVLYDAYSLDGDLGSVRALLPVENNPILDAISYQDITLGKIVC